MNLSNKKHNLIIFSLIAFLAVSCSSATQLNENKASAVKQPKNIIVFVSDGMGFNHLAASNYFMHGQQEAQVFEQDGWEKFAMATYPSVISVKGTDTLFSTGYNPREASSNPHYPSKDYTDSGAAGTALSTGTKVYNGSIGLGIKGDTLVHMSQAAKALGKSAGVVSSVQLSHATPASFSAHNQHRNNYDQIARYMFFNTSLDVIMAAGNPDFDNDGNPKESDGRYVGGREVWEQLKLNDNRTTFQVESGTFSVQDVNGDNQPDPWTLVQTREDFIKLANGTTPLRVLGVPQVNTTLRQGRTVVEGDTMPFQTPVKESIPTLQEMTLAAINVLNQNPQGFFVMVEGGAVDWASHDNNSVRAIEEQVEFNKAVTAAIEWVEKYSSWDETLIIVTADHECGYLSGPGEPNPIYARVSNNGKGNLPAMQWHHSNHTNQLVPFFAKGPGAEYFSTMADENDPVHGPFIQNTAMANLVFMMWGKPEIKTFRLK